MIITKTPFRMSFFGGGTDMESFFREYGGAVLSTTFDKYCYVNVRHLPPFFSYATELSYAKTERVNSLEEIEHPAIRNAMKMLDMHHIRLTYEADLPARSGLGTSSSFAVGMLNAFYALKGQYASKEKLAKEAIYLERVLCAEVGGWQDQIAAAFGGFNRIDFSADGYEVRPVLLSPERKRRLNGRLMMFFTGFTRFSAEIQQLNNSRNGADKLARLQEMLALVDEAEAILTDEQADLNEFGRLLDHTWKLKRGTGAAVSTDCIDALYARGIAAGALGGKLLGAGGGGDPYVGKLVAIGAVQECGPVTLLEPEEVPDDALVVPIAMMGAPTVLAEKAIGGNEYKKLFDMVSKFFGREIYAFMPIEAGGVNSMLPIAAAARLGMPMVDVDGMGRAFPELQMVTFTIGGIKATPMALVDEKGNSCIFETITNKWTEELARSVTMSCGASVSVSLYPMSGKQMKEFGVHGIVTRSQQLGKAIRTVKDCGDQTPEEHFLEMSEGFKLFKGKIADVLRETRAGFNFGKVVLEGIGEYKGHTAYVEFQNENLTATVDGKILATTPDLISLVDTETYIPVTTDGLKYGKRVMVVGLKCFHLWRTEKGIELVGPRYFGVDTDYIPLEERCKGGN